MASPGASLRSAPCADPSGQTDFGRFIRLWRSGLSLAKAAAEIGCTKGHLWELETGRSRNPTVKTLVGISRAYGASVPYLAHLAARSLNPPEAV